MKYVKWLIAFLLVTSAAVAQVPIVILLLPPPLIPNTILPLNQIFDDNVVNPPVTLLGVVSLIWAPENSLGTQQPLVGIPSYFYTTAYRNNYSSNNLQDATCIPGGTNPYWDWFLCRHPDWIHYQSDQMTPAWDGSNRNFVPLNFGNPAVLAFMETGAGSSGATTNLQGAFATVYPGGATYAGAGIDNANFENVDQIAGYYSGTPNLTLCSETSPSCGGTLTWVTQFPTPYQTADPLGVAFRAVSTPYLASLRQWINSQGKTAWCNFQEPNPDTVIAGTAAALQCGNIVLMEDYMMDGTARGGCADGHTPNYTAFSQWPAKLAYAQGLSGGAAISAVDYLCPGYNASNALPPQIAWGTANFLLVRNSISYYSVRDASASTFGTYPSSFFPPCGTAAWSQAPVTLAGLNSGGSYERILAVAGSDPVGSKICYAEVNPHDATSGITSTYTLPSGTWQDQFGNTLSSGANTLQPATGIIAVKVG